VRHRCHGLGTIQGTNLLPGQNVIFQKRQIKITFLNEIKEMEHKMK
jgi:hypothetical protein